MLPIVTVMSPAQVSVLYDPTAMSASELDAAFAPIEAAESRIQQYSFYKCDTSLPVNARLAQEANVTDGIYVFVRTPEDGIEEYTLPLEVSPLVRYLHLRGIAGDPADVEAFHGKEALTERVQNRPVFVLFEEPWCPYCYKMKRTFEAGATFFQGRVVFMHVDCRDSLTAEAFCDAEGVTAYPTLRLFTRDQVIPYDGPYAVAAFERFFYHHRARFPQGAAPEQPVLRAAPHSRYPLAPDEPVSEAPKDTELAARVNRLELRLERIETLLQKMTNRFLQQRGESRKRDEL